MPHQNTVLDHLFEELATVSEHYTLTGRQGSNTNIVAYLTTDHTGPDVQTLNVTDPLSGSRRWKAAFIEVTGPELASVLDELLGKIAAAAPQNIPVPA
jgi:hypothetical protein